MGWSNILWNLMQAWLRELPTGVLDSLTPEQVMNCNSEDECTSLVKLLPPTEAALLDWAINLMADVVNYEHRNKMNARNIAMVFAPNMTQMADPLTALIHAVQVMNFLKTLIEKTLRGREEAFTTANLLSSCSSTLTKHSANSYSWKTCDETLEYNEASYGNFLRSATLDKLESDTDEKFWSFKDNDKAEDLTESTSDLFAPKSENLDNKRRGDGYNNSESESILDRLSFSRGVKKLCRHPVFQLSRAFKRSAGAEIVHARGNGREERCA
uniref:Rho-GAP domain-containing protein n=1 Tax=Kalanchoe fedtschenkoi TaxID=63787 RepID=A0A7N0RCZ8_KALFE